MSKVLWNTLKACPTVLGATLLVASAQMVATADTGTSPSHSEVAQATPSAEATTDAPVDTSNLQQVQRYSNEGNEDDAIDQITNASQFRDVQPSDWAFEALDRIVQKYGCLVGYPDGTYRGNRALSRYEFAAGLNACLRQIETLISNQPQSVSRTDFESLQRLSEEFRTELATLGTRVDNLEGRTAFLEQRQFSTTTKLVGEVIIAASDVFGDTNSALAGDQRAVATGTSTLPLNVNTILSDRVRINFDSSFTGKDRLRTRLQARNTTPFSGALTGTNQTRLGFDGVSGPAGGSGNVVDLGRLEYRFPLGSVANVYVEAVGLEFNDNIYTFNPFLETAGSGSISRFGRFNPIYRQAGDGTGVTLDANLSKQIGLVLAYGVPPNIANNPGPGLGLFDGSYSALAQLAFRPSNAVNVGFTYVHSYYNAINSATNPSVTSSTGTNFANSPFGNVPTSANNYGVEASLRLSPQIVLSGWGGYSQAKAENGPNRGRNADIWNYAVTLAFPDFGKKGNVLGFVAGVPPRAAGNEFQVGGIGPRNRVDRNVTYHLEGFYRYRITDNIEITPGVFVLLNPEGNNANNALYVGTIRTTFKF